MDLPGNHPAHKPNSVASILSGSVLRPSRTFTFPMQRLEPGLKALTSSPSFSEGDAHQKRSCVMRTNVISSPTSSSFSSTSLLDSPTTVSPSSSLSSSFMGNATEGETGTGEKDYDEEKNPEEEEEEEEEEREKEECNVQQHRRRRYGRGNREFPPPIPLLARTENLPCHMPWVLKKYYNGRRLIIKEERVKHHEYFRAHRANGRLTLHLVPLDDVPHTHTPRSDATDDDGQQKGDDDNDNAKEEEVDESDDKQNNRPDDDQTNEEESMMIPASSVAESSSLGVGGGGGAKCSLITSSGVSLTSDLFRLPIPTIKPIHG